MNDIPITHECRAARPGSGPGGMRGFSIVELMVAIALGAILLAGAITLFVSNRQAYQTTTDLARLQENARFALETMVRDIRMAGYFGCVNDLGKVTDTTGSSGTGVLWDPTVGIEGIDNADGSLTWSPSGVEAEPTGMLAGTDGITVRFLATRLPDHQVVSATSASISVQDDFAYADGVLVGAADCGGGELFQLDHPNGSGDAQGTGLGSGNGTDLDGNAIVTTVLNVAGTLTRAYTAQAEGNPVAAPFVVSRYYVRNNDFGIPSLFRDTVTVDATDGSLQPTSQELFEGIADLQVLYGVDTDNDSEPEIYVRAGTANLSVNTDWINVVSVRIGMLVQTADPARQPVTQDLPDLLDKDLPVFADNFRRRQFTTTVQVRNL